MKKLYFDQTELKSCIGVFIKDAEIIHTGTTVHAMSVKSKNAEYDRYAVDYGIHFIFADDVPEVDFYAVPQFDVFATDGEGGLLGTVGEETDPRGEAQVGFISKDRKVYIAAPNFKEFVMKASNWKQQLRPYTGITFYGSKTEAEKELEFISPYELR